MVLPTRPTSSALIVAPPTSLVPAAYFTSPELARYLHLVLSSLPSQHSPSLHSLHTAVQLHRPPRRQQPHKPKPLLLPPAEGQAGLVARPLLLLPPCSPKALAVAVDASSAAAVDNCSVALCFRFLDWPSLLACRSVSQAWNEQSRYQLIGDGRGWVHRHDAAAFLASSTGSSLPLSPPSARQRLSAALDNSYVRSLCASLPFLRLLDLSKQDKLSRVDSITERALAYVATLSSLTSLTLTHYSVAVSDRSCLHLCKLRQLRSLSLSACRRITSQTVLYLATSPLARSLTALDLSSCYGLTDVSALREMRSLTSVDLSECRRLIVTSLSALAAHSLTKLSLRGTHTTTKSLSFLLRSPATIRSLDLRSSDVDVTVIHLLTHLRPTVSVLRLADCALLSPAFLPSLSLLLQTDDLPSQSVPFLALRYLDLARLPAVITDTTLPLLPPLAPSLQILSIASTPITTTAPLTRLASLHSLDADLCQHLASLRPLCRLPGLLRLSLWDCGGIAEGEVLGLMVCGSLRHVNLCGVRGVTGAVWEGWVVSGGMAGLERLNVRFCGGVASDRERLRAARPGLTLLD